MLVVMFTNEEQRKQLVGRLGRLITYPVYRYRYYKFWYCTRIYFAKRKQTNEHAYVYVYVGKKRKFLQDIRWKFSEWFERIRHRLRKGEANPPKVVNPNELGVIQVLAVYDNRSHQWERVPPLYEKRWGTTLVMSSNLELVRPPSPRYYDPETGEDQWEEYHAWHKPVIGLLLHPSRLCRITMVELKDFKREHKLCFISERDRHKPSRGQISWRWKRREL